MQAIIIKFGNSPAVTSAAFITMAMLGSSKRLLEYFPGTTRSGLWLSAALGIVTKLASERMLSTQSAGVKKCLPAARVALCTLLVPQLGISLRASFLLFALSEACLHCINAVRTSHLRPEHVVLTEAIKKAFPLVRGHDGTFPLKSILEWVRTKADKEMVQAEAMARSITDHETQSQALLEIVKVAISKDDIKTAKTIASSMTGWSSERLQQKAYIEIVKFEAKRDQAAAEQTLKALDPLMPDAHIVTAAWLGAQPANAERAMSILIPAMFATTRTAFLPFFIELIQMAAQNDLASIKKFTRGMNNLFFQVIAWIELIKIDSNAAPSLSVACSRLLAEFRSSALPFLTKAEAFLACAKTADLAVAKKIMQSLNQEIQTNPCEFERIYQDRIISPAWIEIVKREMQTDPSQAYQTAQTMPILLDRALAMIAIAKQLTKQPHSQLTPPQVLEQAVAAINASTSQAGSYDAGRNEYEIRKHQALIKLLKIKLRCGIAIKTPLIPDLYKEHASVETVKVLALSGKLVEAREMALKISAPTLKVHALIAILKHGFK